MDNRDNPENSLGVATVKPVICGRATFSQCRVDYPFSVQNDYLRFADPPVLIGVPEDFYAHATIRQEKEVIQQHQFSHIEFELGPAKGCSDG
jgi:hypothetical protein